MKNILIFGIIIVALWVVLAKKKKVIDLEKQACNTENVCELPCIDGQARYLTADDIGKVFISVSDDNAPSAHDYGKYKILSSINSEMYNFRTFDLIHGKIIGKMFSDNSASPSFKQVKIGNEMLEAAMKACENHSLLDKCKNEIKKAVDGRLEKKSAPMLFSRFKEKGYTIEAYIPNSSSEPWVWTVKFYKNNRLVRATTVPMNHGQYPRPDGVDVQRMEDEADRIVRSMP